MSVRIKEIWSGTLKLLMKSKTRTLKNIENYKYFMVTRGYGIQVLRTDQGTEYSSPEMHYYLKANGSVHTPTWRELHAQMHVV